MPETGKEAMKEITKCRQCGNPIEKAHPRRIVQRDNSAPNGLLIRTLDFCSRDCGAYYQMGCEG